MKKRFGKVEPKNAPSMSAEGAERGNGGSEMDSRNTTATIKTTHTRNPVLTSLVGVAIIHIAASGAKQLHHAQARLVLGAHRQHCLAPAHRAWTLPEIPIEELALHAIQTSGGDDVSRVDEAVEHGGALRQVLGLLTRL